MEQTVYFQRIEAACIFAASLYFYILLGFPILWFVILLFSVDIFMLGYFINKSVGAYIYNIGHSGIIPTALLIIGSFISSPLLLASGLVWAAHIGWDRAFGYGLKFASGFNDTHLGHLGHK